MEFPHEEDRRLRKKPDSPHSFQVPMWQSYYWSNTPTEFLILLWKVSQLAGPEWRAWSRERGVTRERGVAGTGCKTHTWEWRLGRHTGEFLGMGWEQAGFILGYSMLCGKPALQLLQALNVSLQKQPPDLGCSTVRLRVKKEGFFILSTLIQHLPAHHRAQTIPENRPDRIRNARHVSLSIHQRGTLLPCNTLML